MTLDDLRPEVERRLGRLRTRWVFLVQIGVGVLVAWLVASKLLGHANPFFAPNAEIVPRLEEYMDALRKSGDSVGAKIICMARNPPPGHPPR